VVESRPGKEKVLEGQAVGFELVQEVLGRKGVIVPETFLDNFLGTGCSFVFHESH
jgi:hypothetical protein